MSKFIKRAVAFAAVATVFVGARKFIASHTGPGDDILVPEGSKPSWR